MTFSLTNSSAHFKETYGPISQNVYNSKNVTLARVKKDYKFVGKYKVVDVPMGFNGGVGSGSLPTASYDPAADAIIRSKKVYATVKIDREAIKAADGDKGSFVSQTKHTVKKGVESWMRNMSRILFNEMDNGMLGQGDGATTVTGDGSTGTPYVVKMSATAWKEANWEENDGVNYASETTLLLVNEVVPSTRVVKFTGTSAGLAAAAGSTSVSGKFYMQKSKDNDPTSLISAIEKSTGTLYDVTVKRRWQGSVQQDSSGTGITTDLLNEDMLEIERKCGEAPNLIVTSYTQYRKLLNLLEDKKEYVVEPRAENLKGQVSFKGLQFISASGPVPIFPERFMPADRVLYLNDNYIEIHHRPDFGWFDDDGTVFLRGDGDEYEARYGGYLEVYCPPTFHGSRKGLAA